MLDLPDFSIIETLHESDETVVYRAQGPRGPVILKTSAGEFPRPSTVARLRNEYALGAKLQLDGTVRYLRLIPQGKTFPLLIEDSNARPLSWLLRPKAALLSVDAILGVSILLAEAIEELHRHDVVHRDISPNNIFNDADSGELKLGDLGLASSIPRTRQVAVPPGQLEGTIACISPEQTGRMNRDMDDRTDLCSLGAILYHLACRRTPFEGEDMMAVVHGHIARDPEPPHHHRPDLPSKLSTLLISHHVVERLDRPDEFTLRQVDRVYVKGRHQPVDLFEVIEAEPPESAGDKRATLAHYSEGITHYYAAEFIEAARLFAECLARNPRDQNALTYLARCRKYMDGVPPNWTGVELLKHK